tara:strand:+ start:42 stop:1430 length:1389 start_codon:yes stop_codon:yes gene_type:complete
MHDGPHGTIKIGNKTVQTPGGGFGNPGQAGASIAPPTQASLPPSLGFQPGNLNPYQQAAQTMMQAGITGLGDTNKDRREERERLNQSIPGAGEGILTVTPGAGQDVSTPDDEGKGIFETVLNNTVIANLLKGAQSTDRFFKNLSEKGVDGLTPEDKVILANLIGAGGLDTIDLNKYTTDDVNFEELGKRFTQAASGLENVDYQSLVDSYLSNKPTGIDSLTTMGSDLSNLFGDPRLLREDGSYTLEGLKEQLGPEGIAYLKATNPKLYYSFTDPQTSGGLAELAQFDLSTLGGSPEDRRLAARVMAAREATSNQGGGGQAGIPSLPSSGINLVDVGDMGPFKPFTGPYSNIPQQYAGFFDSSFNKPVAGGMAVSHVTLPDGSVIQFPDTGSAGQFQQYLDSIGVKQSPDTGIDKIGTTVNTGIPAALNYANIAPQFTGSPYTNQGVSPMLGDYYGNLRRYYG